MSSIIEYFQNKSELKRRLEAVKSKSRLDIEEYREEYRTYAEYLKNSPLEKKILYESERGKKMDGSSYNLFQAFQSREDFAAYQHIWIIRKRKEYKEYKKKYAEYSNVKFLLIEEEIPVEYYMHLATSTYLVNEGLFPTCFVKREGQCYISIPSIEEGVAQGYQIQEGGYKMSNRMHNYLQTDFLIIKNIECLDILKTAYKLEGIYKGDILVTDPEILSKDIWETILNENKSINVISGLPTEKKTLLIYGGGLAMNGVTEALMALLKKIDYDSYDVTVLFWLQDGTYSRRNLQRVDTRARVLLFRGADPMTEDEHLEILYLKDYGLSDENARKIYARSRYLLKRAAARRLGNTSYDIIIDFSGYAAWFPMLLLEVEAKKRLIWQHPDIKEDFLIKNSRNVANKSVQLEGLLSVYEKFDKIVSVNEVLMKINREKVGGPETYQKFYFATNLMDEERLNQKLAEIDKEAYLTDNNGRKYIVYDSENTSIDGAIRMIPKEKPEGAYRFVTMGRLSQEKNHINLIIGFKKFLKMYPDSQLFIIGKGSLYEELEELITKYKLEKNVILTGNLLNPYLLIKNCDCFIFPSRYEGQGLVVLEVRMFHLPIVISNYEAAPAVCSENGQLMIGMEPEDVFQGMSKFVQGEVPTQYVFDVERYNKKSLDEFYKILED